MKKYPHGLSLKVICDAIDAYRAQEDDLPEEGMIAAFEILLAAMDKPALTAQPVKLPEKYLCVGHMGEESLCYEPDEVISAIRAAGYEVQE